MPVSFFNTKQNEYPYWYIAFNISNTTLLTMSNIDIRFDNNYLKEGWGKLPENILHNWPDRYLVDSSLALIGDLGVADNVTGDNTQNYYYYGFGVAGMTWGDVFDDTLWEGSRTGIFYLKSTGITENRTFFSLKNSNDGFFSGTDLYLKFTISEAIDPDTIVADPAGATGYTIDVGADGDYTATVEIGGDWITITGGSEAGTNNGTVTFDVDGNNSPPYETRFGSIKISTTTDDYYCTIEQGYDPV